VTRLEAAEMRFLRSIKGYTRLDKIRSEVIRKELEISGIQDVRSKHKQNRINHLERVDNTRLLKRPQLQTLRKKRSWTPQETMATHRCRNRSDDSNPWRKMMMILINLYMLRVTMYPSSGETTVFMQHWVLVILYG
jgi:hypothetical protein